MPCLYRHTLLCILRNFAKFCSAHGECVTNGQKIYSFGGDTCAVISALRWKKKEKTENNGNCYLENSGNCSLKPLRDKLINSVFYEILHSRFTRERVFFFAFTYSCSVRCWVPKRADVSLVLSEVRKQHVSPNRRKWTQRAPILPSVSYPSGRRKSHAPNPNPNFAS